MNKIIITGNITRDIDLAETASGTSYCNFSVAVNRAMPDSDGNKQTDFFNCTAWRQRAEVIAKYCKKGSKVLVEGEMQSRSYEDKDGHRQTGWNINITNIEFLGSRQENFDEGEQHTTTTTRKRPTMQEIDDGGLPF